MILLAVSKIMAHGKGILTFGAHCLYCFSGDGTADGVEDAMNVLSMGGLEVAAGG